VAGIPSQEEAKQLQQLSGASRPPKVQKLSGRFGAAFVCEQSTSASAKCPSIGLQKWLVKSQNRLTDAKQSKIELAS
jgi:hypothetical protein